jgi:hypothetical protein
MNIQVRHGSTKPTGNPTPSCGTPTYDVWHKFVAHSSVENIRCRAPGTCPCASWTGFANRVQLLAGACGSLISCLHHGVTCDRNFTHLRHHLAVRVYLTSAVPQPMELLIFVVTSHPPAVACAGAATVAYTSATSCNPVPGDHTWPTRQIQT